MALEVSLGGGELDVGVHAGKKRSDPPIQTDRPLLGQGGMWSQGGGRQATPSSLMGQWSSPSHNEHCIQKV